MFARIRNQEKPMSHKALMQMLDQCEKEMFPDEHLEEDEPSSTPMALKFLSSVAQSISQALVN